MLLNLAKNFSYVIGIYNMHHDHLSNLKAVQEFFWSNKIIGSLIMYSPKFRHFMLVRYITEHGT
jgi:hypothetical protein